MEGCKTILFKDGEYKELDKVDRFEVLLEDIKKAFIDQNGGQYVGYPNIPSKLEREVTELFKSADDLQKEWIFSRLLLEFTSSLQHWTTDLDKLYPKDQEFDENDIRGYMKRGWERFYY